MNVYKVEPYVMAADVYAEPTHKGRGGWTWYTGSAGWMYQLIIEWFIGLKRKGNELEFRPCLPEGWDTIKIDYKYLETVYHIQLKIGIDHAPRVIDNGNETQTTSLTLVNDMKDHEVTFFIGVGNVGKIKELV
ncbi:MAG: hypothetical protein ABIT58_06355, partial [Ferruginibacter sp.]